MAEAIARVSLTHLQIPLKEPFRISAGSVTVKDAVLVAVETTDGRVGLGEASPMAESFGYSDDTPGRCWDDLTGRIAPHLIGRAFTSTDDLEALTATWTGSRAALAGAETACWDLLAQARHESLAAAFGASAEGVAQGVESGLAVGLYPTVVEMLRTVEIHLVEGYKRLKIKIAPGRDVELVRAVRQHFGDLPLMVDANGAYTRADLDVFRQLDEFGLLMIEQPTAAADLDGLVELQAALATPVCLDETADTPERAEEALVRGGGRIVNLKIQRMGGFGPVLELYRLCERLEVACWVGTMPELGVGQAQGLHLAALANCKYPTDVEPSARWFVDDYTVPLLELTAPGLFAVPDRPGLGIAVDPAKVKRYAVRRAEFPEKG